MSKIPPASWEDPEAFDKRLTEVLVLFASIGLPQSYHTPSTCSSPSCADSDAVTGLVL